MYNTLEMLSEIWYTYDDGRREKAYTYTYNYDGTLNKIDDLREDSSIEFTYDSRGRLVSSLEAYADDLYSANWNRVNYDTENRVSSHIYSITYSSTDSALTRYFTTSYEYETNGYVSRENLSYLSNSHNINYNYDSFNRPDEVVRNLGGFNYTTKYTYLSNGTNTSNRISKYVNTVNGTEKDYTYTYNSKGNITKANYPNGESITYVYDNLGQLLREEHELANTNYEYTYDDAGNITTIKKIIINESLDDDFIQLRAIYPIGSKITTVNLRYTNSEWGDLLTSYDGTAITYDEIGNPLSYYNGTSYEFEWEGRRLVSAVKGSDTLSFTYNDEGIRTGKTVNGVKHTYYLNGSLIMAEEWEDKLIVYIYDASGSPIGMMFRKTSYDIEDWDVYWFEKNLQGDVVSVYNNAGDEVAYYMYNEAWGSHSVGLLNSADNEGARYNPFRYRGYYYDTDLGMYYLQSRYYDSKICRFINADSAIAGVGGDIRGYNLFAYCFNNPVNMSDSTGNWPSWSQAFLNAAMVSLLVAAVAGAVVVGAPVLAAAGVGVVSTGVTTVATSVAIAAVITAGVAATAAIVTSVVENQDYQGPIKNQSVYVMRDKITNEVKYVGRTNNPIRRQAEHEKDPNKANLKPLEVKFSGLTMTEARAMEQVLISSYSLSNLSNARREIAVGNVSDFAGKMENIISIFVGSVESDLLNLMGR